MAVHERVVDRNTCTTSGTTALDEMMPTHMLTLHVANADSICKDGFALNYPKQARQLAGSVTVLVT